MEKILLYKKSEALQNGDQPVITELDNTRQLNSTITWMCWNRFSVLIFNVAQHEYSNTIEI